MPSYLLYSAEESLDEDVNAEDEVIVEEEELDSDDEDSDGEDSDDVGSDGDEALPAPGFLESLNLSAAEIAAAIAAVLGV